MGFQRQLVPTITSKTMIVRKVPKTLTVTPRDIVQNTKGNILVSRIRGNLKPKKDLLRRCALWLYNRYPQYDKYVFASMELPGGKCVIATNIPVPGSVLVRGHILWCTVFNVCIRNKTVIQKLTHLSTRHTGPESKATVANCRRVGLNIP